MTKAKPQKWAALFLVCALVLSLLPGAAFAAQAADGDAAAQIGDRTYESLAQALSAAGEDGVGTRVVLLEDVTDCSRLPIAGKEVTVDLNGHDIGFAYNSYFRVQGGTLNLTGEGKVYEQSPYYSPVMMYGSSDSTAENYSVVNVGSGVTLQGWAGLFMDPSSGNANYGMVAAISGTLISVKDIDGGDGHALYVNGQIANTEGAVPRITLDGATLLSSGNGMYLAGYTETVIRNSTITSDGEGGTGIEIRAGKLTISNSSITGGSGEYEGAPNGNGSTSQNVALAVAQHTTELPLEVTVESGTLTGGAAFVQANPQGNGAEAVEKVQIEILDGTFDGQVYSENKEGFISGGTYSEALESAYVFPGLTTQEDADGNTVIKKLETVYLDGAKGDDANSGADASQAVKSLDTAVRLVAGDGVIYICGQVNVGASMALSGVTIRRAEGYFNQLISVNGSDVELTLSDVTIDGNNVTGVSSDGYLVFVSGGATLNIEDGARLIHNQTAAVYVNVGSTLNMNGGAISGNTWTDAAMSGGGGIINCGTTTINGGEISQNHSATWGGGILNTRGTVTLNGGEIKNNTAAQGAGIATIGGGTPGTITILDGASISGNRADNYGGGVYVQGVTYGDELSTVFEMRNGSITGNTAENVTGAGIFGYYYNGETIIRISGGTVADNVSTEEGMGNAIGLYGINGDYAHLELSGSPVISGDVFFQNDYPDGYVIRVTDEFNPADPVVISRSNNAYEIVAVEYAAGVTPKAGDFASDAIFETLVIDGQTLKWASAGIVYFYADDEAEEEYEDFRQGVVIGGKIDPANVPTPEKTGYTLEGWRVLGTETVWNFDSDTVEGSRVELVACWKLDAPAVSVSADTLTPHMGSDATLTAAASHALDGVAYTYQWYKDGAPLEGETGSTLAASESGSYTVRVTAVDGQAVSAQTESAPAVVTVAGHNAGTEWKSDADSHWHECADCDEKLEEASHTFVWVTDKEATETEKGAKHEECSVCGYEKAAVEIPATGTGATDPAGPQTGETGSLLPWFILLFVSAGSLTGASLYARRRKEQ
ncbi:MAG TPA: hypothetical protein H9684_01715 [Firmicutes bacterium]|nr:hypothetical protein [Bacillota bacterium]